MRIAIAGAGLGGLTAGITLRQAGVPVTIYEAARTVERTGAGLTLGIGAQHVFRALGIQETVAAKACPAGNLPFLHYASGEVLMGSLDLGDGRGDDGGANIVRHIYRADLQDILIEAFERLGGDLKAGCRVTRFSDTGSRVVFDFEQRGRSEADLLVGADGVRSAIRQTMFPGDNPRFTGHVAYRFLVPMEQARPFMKLGRSAIFIGPGRTFNRYSMAQGMIVNGAALVETGQEVPEGWSNSASMEELMGCFGGWHPDVTGLIERAGSIIKWGLFDRAPIDSWTDGRVTLLGDAAHAMLPYLGMGAAMAVEDGYVLARLIAREDDLDAALAKYEAKRIPRTAQVHAASKLQGEITESIDPDNFALAGAPVNNAEMMMFDPTSAFE